MTTMTGTREAMAVLSIVAAAASVACVVETLPAPTGVASFRVELLGVEPASALVGEDCAGVPPSGTPSCVRAFPSTTAPHSVHLRVRAVDHRGALISDFSGFAQLDVRPGRLANVGPAGSIVTITNGAGEITVDIANAHGETRIWVEDCGSSRDAGSFATGISPPLWFDRPMLTDINVTDDNATGPMRPEATNVCAISGDPRFGLGADEDGKTAFVGYSNDGKTNAPPPAMGDFLEVAGCSRAQYLADGGCARGPLVVTGVANDGFYVTDINPAALNAGFNHVFAFTFNFPEDIEMGDVLLALRGTPVEFAGTTQIGNPGWQRDRSSRYRTLLPAGVDLADCLATPPPAACPPTLVPKAIHLTAPVYRDVLRTYGRNDPENLVLERIESALVCMDNLAPASDLRDCDTNNSGSIERNGCSLDPGEALPPRCSESGGQAAGSGGGRRRGCSSASSVPACLPLSAQELAACGLSSYLPANPAEYCCERLCYQDLACTETMTYRQYGQWVADVYGTYEASDYSPTKIAIVTRDVAPEFDPLAFARAQRATGDGDDSSRQRLRIIGNLRHVVAARPVWLIVARSARDIAIDAACP